MAQRSARRRQAPESERVRLQQQWRRRARRQRRLVNREAYLRAVFGAQLALVPGFFQRAVDGKQAGRLGVSHSAAGDQQHGGENQLAVDIIQVHGRFSFHDCCCRDGIHRGAALPVAGGTRQATAPPTS